MKSLQPLLKILLPSILLIFIFRLTTGSFIFDFLGYSYYPISFGLIIGIVNDWRFKVKTVIRTFYSLCLSLVTFSINFLLTLIVGYELGYYIIVFFVSPIFVLYAYYKFYNVKLTKFIFVYTLTISIFLYFTSIYSDTLLDGQDPLIFNLYLIWQVTVAITLQLILHKKELFTPSGIPKS